MKQYRLIYSRLSGCVFLLFSSVCISFPTMTHSQVVHHRRLWLESEPRPPPGPSPQNKTISAVLFFGDSIIDTGNNNNLITQMRCNFPPYGIDFPSGVATGRFSNGKVATDYICSYSLSCLIVKESATNAEILGVKPIVPAYFDPKLQPEDLLTGVSFASGGSGYYDMTPKLTRVRSLLSQLKYFQEYLTRVKKLVGQEKTDQLLAKGLAVVVAGSNDLLITYYGQGVQWLKYDVDYFISMMVKSAASFVLQLYGYGAKQILVIGTPPLGCVPSQRTLKGGVHRNCAQDINYASQLFNAKLSIVLDQLAKTLPNSTVLYIDIYSPFSDIIENPQDYGFKEIKKGCCGTGLVEVGPLCNRFTPFVCSNVSGYLFWDSFHPTQRFYKILVKLIFEKYIHHLV